MTDSQILPHFRMIDVCLICGPVSLRAETVPVRRDFQSLPPFDGSVDGAVQNMILLFNKRWRDCIINFLFSSVVFGLVRMSY